MDAFQKIVLIVATIILITLLVIVGILLNRDNENKIFPPRALECPDYWKNIGTTEVPVCQGTDGVNTGDWPSSALPVEFSDNSTASHGKKYDDKTITNNDGKSQPKGDYNGSDTCKYRKWSRHWGIHWDGISNYNSC